MLMNPALSVVICTYNRPRLLERALESLTRQTINPANLEVVVVDNNSTNDTAELIERFRPRLPHFQGLHENRQGLSFARNHGWRSSRGDFIAFLDDDACADPDWCERILTAFRTVSPAPASVGGMILPLYESPPPPWFDDDFEIRTWGDTAHFLGGEWGRFGFSGSNMAFPREILDRFGGFSTELGMVGGRLRLGEERELFYRIHPELPLFWYDPEIRVKHWAPVRNMRINYLLLRSFRAGQSRALIESCQKFSATYLKEVRDLAVIVKELLCSLWPSADGYRANLARKLCRVSHQLGVLVGPGKEAKDE
ncbi:MAG: hypothetical protein C0616_14770 [Desulfuromonas sp.]|nr:MAG: hypothetical protein C0616_14770 [Desulfuromonas sp.]